MKGLHRMPSDFDRSPAVPGGDGAAQQERDLARWKREWLLWAVGTVALVAVWGVVYLVRGKLVLWSLPASIIVVWFLLIALAPFVPAKRPAKGQDGT